MQTMASNACVGERQPSRTSAWRKWTWSCRPACRARASPARMPASLTSTPVTRQPTSRARNSAGPPEPQPTSRTWSVGGQVQESEEPPVLVGGHPAALAEVFAVGFAPHLLQGLRGEIAVGRAVKIHGWGHGFLVTNGGNCGHRVLLLVRCSSFFAVSLRWLHRAIEVRNLGATGFAGANDCVLIWLDEA